MLVAAELPDLMSRKGATSEPDAVAEGAALLYGQERGDKARSGSESA